jgi:PqqD family protein of HPr-rel-A system
MWRIRSGQELLHRCWDHECVLYNNLSGSTHLLDPATIDLLACLAEQAMSPAALVDEGYAEAGDIDALLRDLELLHLIEPLPC